MKRIGWFLILLITAIGLAACTESKEPTSKPGKSAANEQVYQNEVFKDVVVNKDDDKFVVTGKAQVFEGVFQYQLYDRDKLLKEDHYQTAGAPAWGEFELTFENALISGSKNVRLELFVYSAKDGAKVNVLEVPMK